VEACVAKVRRMGVKDDIVRGDVSNEEDVVSMLGETIEKLGERVRKCAVETLDELTPQAAQIARLACAV
jgi:hypothetical protein